ncbi:head-tail connector protein [Aurantimonas sp. E1-2-R+4]|uniref:head-tail connector protein n=1 Tax=Aurantimonas sp. E1-2-R+4 TaxID=3113714 RepID=UPI002F936041
MSLIRVTGPAAEVLPTVDFKQHSRIDYSDEDALIASYINAAVSRFDGPFGLLGRCLITQTWRLSLDAFPTRIMIPTSPVQSVTSIKYFDASGTEQLLSGFRTYGIGGLERPFILPAEGESWPHLDGRPDAVTVEFVAGYGAAPEDVPADLINAIRRTVAHYFENRESVVIGDRFDELPDVSAAINAHRLWSF